MVEPQPRAPLPGNDERPNLVAVPAEDLSDGQMSFGAAENEDEVLFRISADALIGEDDLVSEDDAEQNGAAGEPSGEVEAEGVVEAEVAEAEPEAPSVALIADLEAQPLPYESLPAAPVDDPSLQARLARVHLRTGSFTLARAELETLAGRNQLDTAGRLDLAEARWRTGDLHGAGEAASAYLAANGEEVLGFVIAAEAAATVNRLAEARGYVEQAMQRYLSDLDPVFAGIARKAMWSAFVASPAAVPVPQAAAVVPAVETAPAVEPAVEQAPEPAVEPASPLELAPEPAVELAPEPAVELAPEPAAALEPTVEQAPEPAVEQTPEPTVEPAAAVEPAPELVAANAEAPEDPTSAQSDDEVASGRSYLEGNDPLMAALHFGLALRLNQTRASAVIEAIGDRQDVPLQMVRDEAVRLRDEAVRLRGEAVRLLGVAGDAGSASQSAVVEPSAPVVEPAVEPAVESEPPAQLQAPEPPPIRWD